MAYLEKVKTNVTTSKDKDGFTIIETSYKLKEDISFASIGLHKIFNELYQMRFKRRLIVDFAI